MDAVGSPDGPSAWNRLQAEGLRSNVVPCNGYVADFLAVRCLVSFPHVGYAGGAATVAKISIFSETRSIVSHFFVYAYKNTQMGGTRQIYAIPFAIPLYSISLSTKWNYSKSPISSGITLRAK